MAIAETLPRIALAARRLADAAQWRRQLACLQAVAGTSSGVAVAAAAAAASVSASPPSTTALSGVGLAGAAPAESTIGGQGAAAAAAVAAVRVPAGFDAALATTQTRVHRLLQVRSTRGGDSLPIALQIHPSASQLKATNAARDATAWAAGTALRDRIVAASLGGGDGGEEGGGSAVFDLTPLHELEEALARAPAFADTSLQVRRSVWCADATRRPTPAYSVRPS